MRTDYSTKPSRLTCSNGFTLIELLIVVVVIGVIAGAITFALNTSGDVRKVRSEALRLATIIKLANDEAIIRGDELGLEVFEKSYRFMFWGEKVDDESEQPLPVETPVIDNESTWQKFNNRVFGEHSLEDALRLRLTVEDSIITATEENHKNALSEDQAQEETPLEPSIYILSTGEMTPFTIEVFHDQFPDYIVTVSGNLLGEVVYTDPSQSDSELN